MIQGSMQQEKEEEEDEGRPWSQDTETDSLRSCGHFIYPQYVVTVFANSRGATFWRHLLGSLTHPIYAPVIFSHARRKHSFMNGHFFVSFPIKKYIFLLPHKLASAS